MRAGLSTIQQTLTPEAATVLNHSIAEAARRNHGQTTPLHVAATLLSSPSGFLRQACIKSHPDSSHPLQCRALELCFSVALERLPTAQNATPGIDPPISNALMAALKRAQAHQRRGCPEQQQQPLLAVKVELEQLVISILDDPSVSRVMREASFSSPAVKATIEQSLNSSATTVNSSPIGLGFRPGVGVAPVPTPANRNLYLNPRLQQNSASQSGQQRGEEIKRVVEILLRSKKRNPVLVGESEPEAVVKEVLRRIENKELAEGALKNVEVIRLEKELASERVQMASKISELGGLIEMKIGSGGIILDLGDLKWLVEQPVPQQQVVSEARRVAVAEMAKLVAKFGAGRLWLIGTATCETYLRCQVYHPSMENDWHLQAVPIAARASLSGLFPRLGTNKIPGATLDSLSPLKSFSPAPAVIQRRVSENLDPSRKLNCCPECLQSYEQELAKLLAQDSEVQPGAAQSQLPRWLQNAKGPDDGVKTLNETQGKDQEMNLKQKIQELQKKWKDTCLRNHPNFHQQNPVKDRLLQTSLSAVSLCNQNLLSRQPFQPKQQLNRNLGEALQLNNNLVTGPPALQRAASPPASPVRTELVLGRTKSSERGPEDNQKEHTRDFLGCIPAEPQDKFQALYNEKLLNSLDADSFKRLLKGLVEKVWWQQEAASSVATAVTQCKMGNSKRRSKGDIWLFFTGPDRLGKKKMASTLSELVNGTGPIMISLGSQRSDEEQEMNFRGKTALDRIVEAVRRNPFSVIMLEDIDEADMILRGNIKRAMERGRLADSHGREISLGNVIFIVTANWLPENVKCSTSGLCLDDEKLESLASSGLQLRLLLSEKTSKRRANWLHDENRCTKSRKEQSPTLSFDLNEAADLEDDRADGSRNSSDLTIDHEGEHVAGNWRSPITSSVCVELLRCVDDAIVFKPVELILLQRDIANLITKRFSSIMGEMVNIEVQDNILEKVLAGLWLSRRSLEEWIENALVPSFRQMKLRLPTSLDESKVVRLEMEEDSDRHSYGDWLPSNIRVVTAGV